MCVCNKYLVKTAVFVLWSSLKSEYINSNTRFTHPFNGSFSRTTRVSRYQKGKTNLDFTEARGSEWQWHQWGHVQVCISLQTDNHASTPPLIVFTGRMPFLPPKQQRQSTEDKSRKHLIKRTQRDWSFTRPRNSGTSCVLRVCMEHAVATCIKLSAHALRTPHTPSSVSAANFDS